MLNRLSAFLYGEKAHDREPVTILDIGCSGGVESKWGVFGSSFHAIGFDPLELEIERLRKTDFRPNVRYEAAFVGLSAAQERERERCEQQLSEAGQFYPEIFARSSAWKAAEILAYDYVKDQYSHGAEQIYSTRRTSLDEFGQEHSLSNIDFIKTDTDGHDVEVLIGAETLLRSTVLGVGVECFFHRPNSPYATSFANVDRIMTSKGFYLFGMWPRAYSRAALPEPFEYELLASTRNGSPVFADVLYLRDLAHPDYERLFAFHATPERIMKTACVMECFGLHDCAAELILNRADRLPYPAEQMLDLLVPDTLGRGLTYSEYMRRFTADPKSLLPSRLGRRRTELPLVTDVARDVSLAHAFASPNWGAALSACANGRLEIVTDGCEWAFALVLPLPEHEGAGVLAVELQVIEGQLGLSIANADFRRLDPSIADADLGQLDLSMGSERLLNADRNASTILLPVSGGSVLLVRNGSNHAPSRAILSRITLFAS
jgi:FkbM family methyltransferase